MAPPPAPEETGLDGSHLRFTIQTVSQRQAVVKLHGVFAPFWKVLDYAPVSQFHRFPSGDSSALVKPLMQAAN